MAPPVPPCRSCKGPSIVLSYRNVDRKAHRANGIRWCRSEERVLDVRGHPFEDKVEDTGIPITRQLELARELCEHYSQMIDSHEKLIKYLREQNKQLQDQLSALISEMDIPKSPEQILAWKEIEIARIKTLSRVLASALEKSSE